MKMNSEIFRTILDNISAQVYVADMDTYEILYMNNAIKEAFGGDQTGQLCYKVFRGENKVCSDCPNQFLQDKDGTPLEPHIWENQNNLTGRWYRNQDQMIEWEKGRRAKIQIAFDIQDAREVLHSLEISEERYRSLFNSSRMALLTVSSDDYRIITANPAAAALFGYKFHKELLNLKLIQLLPLFHREGEDSWEGFRQMISLAEMSGSYRFRWRFKHTSGADVPADVQVNKVELDGDQIFLISINDISNQLSAQDLLRTQMDDLGLINSINVAANRSADLESIFRLISRDTRRNFHGLNTTIYLLSEDGKHIWVNTRDQNQQLTEEVRKGLKFIPPRRLILELEQTPIFQDIFRTGKPRVLTNKEDLKSYQKDIYTASNLPDLIKTGAALLIPRVYGATGVNSIMIVPLKVAGEYIGMMDISSKDIFSLADLDRLSAVAEQISGTIQRVRAESDLVHSIQELEFVNRTLNFPTSIDDNQKICQHLADQVHSVNPGAYVMVSLYDPEHDEIRLRAIQGFGGVEEKISRLMGKDPREFLANRSETPIAESLTQLYRSGKLEKTPEGLYDLTRYFVSRSVTDVLTSLTGIDEVYLIGFNVKERMLGGVMLGLKMGMSVQFPTALETVVSHFAETLDARITDNEVRRRKTQLEALRSVELEITSTLTLRDLLSSIAEKAAEIVDAYGSGFSVYNPDKDVLEFLIHTGVQTLPEKSALKAGEGLSGKVWEEQRSIIVENYAEWEGRAENWAELGNYFLAGIPVRWGNERLGVLEIALEPGRRLSRSDIELLEMFATQAAIAIKNARLFEAETQKRQEAETLRELGMFINRNLGRAELLDSILISLQKVLPYDSASVQIIRGDYCIIEAFRSTEQYEGVIGRKFKISDNKLAHPVLWEGKNIVMDDVQQSPEWIRVKETTSIRSWIAVPLKVQDRQIGILTLDHYQPSQYTQQDADLALNFANQAAIALENSRLLEEARQRLFRIESLRQIDLAISGSVNLESSMNVLVRQLITSLDVDAATVLILNQQSNTLEFISGHGFITESLKHTTLRIGEGLAGRAAQEKEMIRISDLSRQKTSLKRSPFLIREKFVSYLAVPLIAKAEVVGVLEVFQRSLLEPDDEWIGFLEALAGQAAIAIDRINLFNDLETSNLDITRAYDATIEGWAKAIELRDSETEGHSRRVVELTIKLAMRLGVSGESLLNIRRGALLHDIGKMAIPDEILMKPDALSEDEWQVMKEHPIYAVQMLSPIEYLADAMAIPYSHHERWDGKGYPQGLKGDKIPLAARIFAVVDVWDALQSDRPYRPGWTQEQAADYIREMSGLQFDPEIVSEFIEMINTSGSGSEESAS